jgi:hypothetical protein
MRRKVLFSAILAVATGATVMITSQSFAASNPETGPRQVAAAPAPTRADTAPPAARAQEPSDEPTRTRKPGAVRAPRQAQEPVTGRRPAPGAQPVRTTPRFTG